MPEQDELIDILADDATLTRYDGGFSWTDTSKTVSILLEQVRFCKSTRKENIMKKILISGSSGFVGSRVLHQWQGRAELFTFPRGSLAAADESDIRRFVDTVQPDVILHLAALSDTGYCQQHPEESRRANVELPVWMAKAARDTGAKLISFSSDQVYAGVTQPGPLPETLPLSPANTYGRHKLEAEERVLALCPEAVLLRAPWMYDLPVMACPSGAICR